jgi:hypothetical protein
MSLQKYSKGRQQERKDRQNAMRQKITLNMAAGSPHLPVVVLDIDRSNSPIKEVAAMYCSQ